MWFRSLFFLPLLLCSYINFCPFAKEMGGAGSGTGSRSVLASASLAAASGLVPRGDITLFGGLMRTLEHDT